MLDRAIARSVRVLPRGLVARVAWRYIAGEDLAAALAVVERLKEDGCVATLDILGEHVTSAEQAASNARGYENALDAIARTGLPSGISVKLTGLGLELDRALCKAHLDRVLVAAARAHRFVRIDMEERAHTDTTLELTADARRRGYRVGTVIQARLRRSPGDIERLMDGGVPVRLVKGIYIEPADVGYTGHEEIRDAFKRLLAQLVEGGAEVAIATHDDVLVSYALDVLRRSRVPPARYEFQMLLGVRPEMRRRLVKAGHRVRVYVPFGRDWFAYSVRRLQENPRMAMLIAKALIWREGNGTISAPPA